MTWTFIAILSCGAAGIALCVALLMLNQSNRRNSPITLAFVLIAFFVPLSLALLAVFGDPERTLRDVQRYMARY